MKNEIVDRLARRTIRIFVILFTFAISYFVCAISVEKFIHVIGASNIFIFYYSWGIMTALLSPILLKACWALLNIMKI
jgi:hypothetical protein